MHMYVYFGGIQTSNTEALTLPVPGNILSSILDFLYSDDAATVEGKDHNFENLTKTNDLSPFVILSCSMCSVTTLHVK